MLGRAPLHLLLLAAAGSLAAACADRAEAPPREPVRTTIQQPRVVPPEVLPSEPSFSRPGRRDPVVRAPVILGGSQVDTFQQSAATVDILWVVDNSGSMADERVRLVASFQAFLDRVIASRSSYRLGVVATQIDGGPGDGRLVGPVIDEATADPRAAFARLLELPETMVRREQGLEAARLAIDPATNPGFLRAGASLAVIVLSDEDDDSFGSPAYFTRAIEGSKGPGFEHRVSFSAIAGPLPDGCRRPGEERVFRGGAKAALRYSEVVAGTGGASGSICADDFVPPLLRVADGLDTLRKRFLLSLAPAAGRLAVTVDADPADAVPAQVIPEDPATGFRYDPVENAIVFEGSYVPPPRSVLRVEYALEGAGP